MGRAYTRQASPADVTPIARGMRASDAREVWASHRHKPNEALCHALAVSSKAWTMCAPDGTPVAMFGVGATSLFSDIGSPWLLGTDALESHAWDFLKHSRTYIREMQKRHSFLENWADSRNERSIRWLRWCGFTLEEPKPHGPDAVPFHRFYLGGTHV